jgi:hypothetical protein
MDGPKAVQISYAQWIIAKLIVIASLKLPALMLRTVMVHDPALVLETQQL